MASESMNMMINMMKAQPQKLCIGEGTDYTACRTALDAQNAMMPVEPGVTCIPGELAGVKVELLKPEKRTGDTVILDIHGGAFIFGGIIGSRSYASVLAGESGLMVYTLDYRLAPENPFPAGSDDCIAVYKALLEKYPDCDVALVGESAGATLALVTALRAKEEGVRLPSCVVAFSPCATFEDILPSRKANGENDIVVSGDTVEDMRRLYVGQANVRNPFVSPMYGDYTNFPPLKLVADNGEVLADDTREIAARAKAAGVAVDCRMYDGTFHTFPNLARFTDESTAELVATVEFIRKHSK